MGDRLRAGIPPRYVTKPTRSTQPCIPLESLNRVPALIGWGKGGNVTSAGWQVTLCDTIWHVSSRSGVVLIAETAIRFLTLPYLATTMHEVRPACVLLCWSCQHWSTLPEMTAAIASISHMASYIENHDVMPPYLICVVNVICC